MTEDPYVIVARAQIASRFIAVLSDLDRRIVEARLAGLIFKDIAAELGIAECRAHTKFHSAIRQMRRVRKADRYGCTRKVDDIKELFT